MGMLLCATVVLSSSVLLEILGLAFNMDFFTVTLRQTFMPWHLLFPPLIAGSLMPEHFLLRLDWFSNTDQCRQIEYGRLCLVPSIMEPGLL